MASVGERDARYHELALSILLALDLAARRSERVDRAFAAGLLPIVLALAIGVSIDAWARPPQTETAPAGVTTPD